MATKEELEARFAAASGAKVEGKKPRASRESDPDEAPEKPKRTRKAKTKEPEPSEGSLSETLTELAAELAEAESAVEALKDRIREACA